MKKKKIEKISLICAFSALVITLGAIPLGSYLGYNAYVDKINANKPSSSSKPTDEIPTDPVLIKIEARLKMVLNILIMVKLIQLRMILK